MADEITQADRELLAAEYERNGLLAFAKAVRANRVIRRDAVALRAIAAARRQGQVSDGGEATPIAWRTVYPDGSHSAWSDGKGHWPETTGFAGGAHGWEYAFAPPSAPVGVEAMPGLRRSLAKIVRLDEGEPVWIEPNEAEAILAALAQQPTAVTQPGAGEVSNGSEQPAAVTEAMVERATMALLGKSHDTAPGIDWRCDRSWTVNKVRKHMRAALTAALAPFTAAQQEGAP